LFARDCAIALECDIPRGRAGIGANPQDAAHYRRVQSYQNVSRETFLSDWGSKPYKAKDCGFSFSSVRLIDFLVQLESGVSGASLAQSLAVWRKRRNIFAPGLCTKKPV
jgi:hypothetical protein